MHGNHGIKSICTQPDTCLKISRVALLFLPHIFGTQRSLGRQRSEESPTPEVQQMQKKYMVSQASIQSLLLLLLLLLLLCERAPLEAASHKRATSSTQSPAQSNAGVLPVKEGQHIVNTSICCHCLAAMLRLFQMAALPESGQLKRYSFWGAAQWGFNGSCARELCSKGQCKHGRKWQTTLGM